MTVKYKPDAYHTITPYIVCPKAEPLIEFLQTAFDAELIECVKQQDGLIGHAEVKIGDSVVMVGGRRDAQPSSSVIYIYVEDTDNTYKKALTAGAKSILEPEDKFYGDRNAAVEDCCGNQWWIATHVKDVDPADIQRLAEEACKKDA